MAADPDSLATVPAVQALAGRPLGDWTDDEFPEWESLNDVAARAYERVTGDEDGLDDALAARGLERAVDLDPTGAEWDLDSPGERAVRLPRLTALLG